MEGAEIKTLSEVEREHILRVLKDCHGNRTHACAALGISIRTLRNKIDEYRRSGYEVPAPGSGFWRCTDCSQGTSSTP